MKSLSATTIGLCALTWLLRPPTTSALTPLLEMNSSAVGRMKLPGIAVRLLVRFWIVVP